MIILAAAIILSLSNSGIISKANKAKTDSDAASIKEYANTLMAEWELMTSTEQEETGCTTNVEYANKKLAEKGYKRELTADGKTVMNEAATAAVKAGIKVGDVVTGYTLDVTTYTTDGSENTCERNDYIETDPQPNTVATNTAITWKYLGVNANGELEIMADYEVYNDTTKTYDKVAAATNTQVTLGGAGGYLSGPTMLNTICEKLYSKDGVGTARSINIDDINSILGYIGEKGAYYNNASGGYTPTKEAKTIAELESELRRTLNGRTTLDGKDLGECYSDYYVINKTNDVKEMKKSGNVDLVYNAKNMYWLASPCVKAIFSGNNAYFDVRCVDYSEVDAWDMSNSIGNAHYAMYAIRPVVSLKSNVKLTQNTEKTAWAIS